MSRFLYIPRKIAQSLGYGCLYNFYCTQEQHKEVVFGYLYNWWAATDSRNIAALGMNAPTFNDLSILQSQIGGEINGYKLKETGIAHWRVNPSATNEYNFNARGSGNRLSTNGAFANITDNAYYLSSDSADANLCYVIRLTSDINDFTFLGQYKKTGASIRLVRPCTGSELLLPNGLISATYTGNDGKIYPLCKIGSQIWLAADLMETKYRDGSLIPVVTDNTAWAGLTTGARCSYGNLESNAGTTKRLAPSGWHVPLTTEAQTLQTLLGGLSLAGGKLKEIGLDHWLFPNTGATDIVGFSGRGSGMRLENGSYSTYFKQRMLFWHPNGFFDNQARSSSLIYDSATFSVGGAGNMQRGLSIRLLKDTSDWIEGETITDTDGNIYPTTKIGDQVWVAANWKCEKWSDGSPIANVTDNTAWSQLTTPAMCYCNNDILNK